jgi:hypothetical protein
MELDTISPEHWQDTFKEVFTPYLKLEGNFYKVVISTKYRGSDFIEFAKEQAKDFYILCAQIVGDSWELHIFTNLDFTDSRIRHLKHTFKLSWFRMYKEYVNLVMNTLGQKLWLDCKTSVGDNKTKAKSKFISIVNDTVFFSYKKKIFCYDCKLKKSSEYIDFRQFDMFSTEVIDRVDFEFYESFIKK